MRRITFRAAITEGLREELERDEAVIVFGEDVGPGALYGMTEGLVSKFGEERIIDTPIA